MNDYFTWKGVSCKSVGITCLTLPEITFPAERVTFTDIPGRNGSLTTLEGDGIYDDVTIKVECYVTNYNNIANIAAFLRGSGKLILPNRSNGYYEARIINQIPFEKIVRGRSQRTFTVNFRCKPMFHLTSGDTEQTISSGTFLNNPTGFTALPLIKITGSGTINLLVGTQSYTFENITNGITLDSELMEAYYGTTLLNDKMAGEFPMLGSGNTAISWTGTVSSVKVTPRWITL